MKKICIIGSSGFAKEVYWLIQQAGLADKVDGFMEPDVLWEEKTIFDVPVLKQSEFNPSIHSAVLGIGDSALRQKIVSSQLPPDTDYPNIIHPQTQMSQWVKVERGAIICGGNILTCDISIGAFALINLDCTIGHDCVIGNYFTCNPGVHLSGNCKLGNHVSLGTGVVVRQGISICDNVTVGMGAVVVKNISEQGIYVGSPAKKLII